jgi:hypothetical protein
MINRCRAGWIGRHRRLCGRAASNPQSAIAYQLDGRAFPHASGSYNNRLLIQVLVEERQAPGVVMTDSSPPISTASVSWVDSSNVIHIRVYSSDGDNITERCYDGSKWVTGQFKQGGTTVSATHWTRQDGEVQIRVYATTEYVSTIEWCWDNPSQGWYKGGYTSS